MGIDWIPTPGLIPYQVQPEPGHSLDDPLSWQQPQEGSILMANVQSKGHSVVRYSTDLVEKCGRCLAT